MSDKSAIEWTDATWNPVTGCMPVTPGCTNCYAKQLHDQRHEYAVRNRDREGAAKLPPQYDTPFEVVKLHPERLSIPLHWKKPRRIFVNSMSDLFHKDVPDDFIDQVFAVMALCPQHTFQILTKRAERMNIYCNAWRSIGASKHAARVATACGSMRLPEQMAAESWCAQRRVLPNVHLGVSVEDQQRADERIPHLLQTPASVRFLSCEPLLGPINLIPWFLYGPSAGNRTRHLNWVIAGGESGPLARPMHPDWARSLRDQCVAASVPFFFKQWGEWAPVKFEDGHWPESHTRYTFDNETQLERVGKARAGRLLDGREWNEFPELKMQNAKCKKDQPVPVP